jgi:hypothetical protein
MPKIPSPKEPEDHVNAALFCALENHREDLHVLSASDQQNVAADQHVCHMHQKVV